MSLIIKSGSTTDLADVTTEKELSVALGRNVNTAGYGLMMSENDDGTLLTDRFIRSPETSADYRLRVGMDTILWNEGFNNSAQNTANWLYTFATLTAAQPGAGTINFSVVQGTTSAHGAFFRSTRYFPLIGTAPLAVEITAGSFTAQMVANEVFLFGIGLPTAATTIPTDGVWLMATSAGLIGVCNYSGSSTQSGTLMTLANAFPVGELHKFAIIIGEANIYFWRDDQLMGSMEIPVSTGQPFITGSLPVFMQKYNTGNVSNTNTMRVSNLTVSLMDLQTAKPWSHQMAGQGLACYQGQSGGTMGTSALLPNATAATTLTGAAISQTVPIAVGLGGQAGIIAGVAGADGLITSFQVPAGGINQTPLNLYITGVRIDTVNLGAAVATTATILQWSLAFGATGASVPSLAQAETGSFVTATAKAWRRVPIGMQSWVVGDAIGKGAESINVNFETPIVVCPGQWIASVAKFLVGTATASQVIWANVSFQGYYE